MKPQHRHVESSIRRRALFPADENSSDSGLGCISPLNFDDVQTDEPFSLSQGVGDYDIIGLVEKSNPISTPKGSNSPLELSTCTPQNVTNLPDDSPTQQLKTPQDTCTNTTLPKLTRKADPISPPASSQLDPKSKVRTALFPDMSLPSKTFYSLTSQNSGSSRRFIPPKNENPEPSRKRKLYLCNRRRFSGQINAGVRHKIKKVKRYKKITIPSKIEDKESSTDEMRGEESDEQSEPELDPSKKFFRSSQSKGVVTIHPNIKLTVNNGKLSMSKTNLKRSKEQGGTCAKKIKLTQNSELEDSFEEESLISSSKVSSLINSLEEKENRESVVLMSPTSQMCNMTSGLALNSPKKMKNLSPILETMPSQQQLFPIFYPGKVSAPSKVDNSKNSNSAKRFKSLPKDQMLLDAGQKRWGATQCSECKIMYHMGDPGDEIMHLNYHDATHIFKFHGWKNERVVFSNMTGNKIIQIIPGDSKIWWKKVKDVMEVVNRDLGFYDMEFNTSNSQIFFYIKNKTIIGVLVAEEKTTGHKLLTTRLNEVELCSEESYPIKCGVSRIWVSQNHRKKGVATALMDSLKRNFTFGSILTNDEIAFSSPTEMGKMFGKNYFKTSNFLIYFV